MPFAEYTQYDAVGLADLVRRGDITPVELVDAAIERVTALNPALNAVVVEDYARAREAAQLDDTNAPFAGVPFLLKDIYAPCAGMRHPNGSRFLRDFATDHDSELVTRYKRAGLMLLGRTNVPELGIALVTEPKHWGPAHNPWDLTRNTGGSSGGAAAAVAARIVPIAHANDAGGSIRLPASCCGVFGLKPTRGRMPFGPDAADPWRGFPIDHAISLTVRDSAALLDATCGPDIGAPYYPPPPERPYLEELQRELGRLRIGVTTTPPFDTDVDPECIAAVDDAMRLCASLGHDVEEATPDWGDGLRFYRDFVVTASAFVASTCTLLEDAAGRKARSDELEAVTRLLRQLGRAIRAEEYELATLRLRSDARRIARYFTRFDILLTPVTATPAPKIGALNPPPAMALVQRVLAKLHLGRVINHPSILNQLIGDAFGFGPFAPIQNVTGQPAMSVPLYWTPEGVPIGVQFATRYADEAMLFRLAGQLEQARPWRNRVPAMANDQSEVPPSTVFEGGACATTLTSKQV